MSDIFLEFVITGGNGYEKTTIGLGDSIMMKATTDTSIRECAKFISKQLASPNLPATTNVRVCMLLGDFGPRCVQVNKGGAGDDDEGNACWPQRQTSKIESCPLADYLCHSGPIMVRLDILDCASQIFVRTLTGKTVILNVTMDDTVRHVKQLLRDTTVEEEPSFQQEHELRIVYAGKQLQTNDGGRGLKDYGISKHSTPHIVSRLPGGSLTVGHAVVGRHVVVDDHGGSFVDVTKSNALVTKPWSKSGPAWQGARPGLCLEGFCRNSQCIAHGQIVIVNKGFSNFDLFKDGHGDKCKCPMCGSAVVPKRVGFNNCIWKTTAIKKNAPEDVFQRAWTKAGNAYTTFAAKKAGDAEFSRLQIFVRKIPPEPWARGGQSTCSICMEPLFKTKSSHQGKGNVEMFSGGCGHYFHSCCIDAWEAAMQSFGRPSCCPLCRTMA